jgi:hypothetical protein
VKLPAEAGSFADNGEDGPPLLIPAQFRGFANLRLTRPVQLAQEGWRFQNLATGLDLGFYAAGSFVFVEEVTEDEPAPDPLWRMAGSGRAVCKVMGLALNILADRIVTTHSGTSPRILLFTLDYELKTETPCRVTCATFPPT